MLRHVVKRMALNWLQENTDQSGIMVGWQMHAGPCAEGSIIVQGSSQAQKLDHFQLSWQHTDHSKAQILSSSAKLGVGQTLDARVAHRYSVNHLSDTHAGYLLKE